MLTAADLRPIVIFASLTMQELETLARDAADMRLLAGQFAYHEGDEGGLFAVISGRLEVIKLIDGSQRRLGERKAGQILGEIPLVYGTRFPSSGRALEPSQVMHLEFREYHELAARKPEFAAAMRALAAERIGGLQGIAAEPFKAQATAVGDPLDPASQELRRFFERNHISYNWLAPDAPDLDSRWNGAPITPADLPAVLCTDGSTLKNPGIRLIAAKLGLNTSPRQATYDTVIIGGGPAGLAAAVYGASEGLITAVIEREAPGGQAGTSSRIENYLGFPGGISGDELADRAHRQATRLGAEIVMTRQAIGIDPATGTIRLDGDDTIHARTTIIATGVSWRKVAIEGFDSFVGKGVFYGTARSDARIAQGRDVHLIGAGNSAGQAAMFMSSHARSVTLIVRGDALEKSMSQYLIEQIRGRSNIRLALNSQVSGVRGTSQLEEVDIRDASTAMTRSETSGGVFVFIGADAETSWLPDAIRRDARGYILTGIDLPKDAGWTEPRDPYLLETSVPGIFACGDVRYAPVKRVAAAVGEGSMAIAFIHQYLGQLARRERRA